MIGWFVCWLVLSFVCFVSFGCFVCSCVYVFVRLCVLLVCVDCLCGRLFGCFFVCVFVCVFVYLWFDCKFGCYCLVVCLLD